METWKDVKGYEGRYKISDMGNVWSVRRHTILRARRDRYGYMSISLYGDNRKYTHHTIHRLVAMAFLPNPTNLPQVNHVDGDKKNNNMSNLAWVSASENIRHAFEVLKRAPSRGRKVKCIETGKIFDSLAAAARWVKLDESTIYKAASRRILNGKYIVETAGGYHWKYVPVE